MHTVEITKDNIAKLLDKEGIVLIDCWASWCGPCRAFAPIYEAVAAKHPDIVFGKIDTEAQPELASAFQIRAIPTLMAFRDGVLLFSQAGLVPAAAVGELIANVRALDMKEVHARIAAREEQRQTG